jgi:hypothetical protein
MDIVGKITSYARAVPAGLKAAGQELAKTASAMTGADSDTPAAPRRRKKTTARRGRTTTRAKAKPATAKQPKAKRATAKGKKRKAKR